MRLQMTLLTMNGNKESGLQQAMDNFQFLLTSVTRDMQALKLVVDDLRSLAIKFVDNFSDGFFIAGNGGCGDDHTVGSSNLDLTMARECHAVKR